MNKGKLLIAGLLGFLLVFGVVLASCDNGATTYEVDDDGKIIADKPAAPSKGKSESDIFDDSLPSVPGGGDDDDDDDNDGPGGSYKKQPVLTGAELETAREIVEEYYEESGASWGTLVDSLNAAVKGLNLPKTDPKDWSAQQISDAFYYGGILFAGQGSPSLPDSGNNG